MSDDQVPRKDPLLSANSLETPIFSGENGGPKWFALLFVGLLVFSYVLYLLFFFIL